LSKECGLATGGPDLRTRDGKHVLVTCPSGLSLLALDGTSLVTLVPKASIPSGGFSNLWLSDTSLLYFGANQLVRVPLAGGERTTRAIDINGKLALTKARSVAVFQRTSSNGSQPIPTSAIDTEGAAPERELTKAHFAGFTLTGDDSRVLFMPGGLGVSSVSLAGGNVLSLGEPGSLEMALPDHSGSRVAFNDFAIDRLVVTTVDGSSKVTLPDLVPSCGGGSPVAFLADDSGLLARCNTQLQLIPFDGPPLPQGPVEMSATFVGFGPGRNTLRLQEKDRQSSPDLSLWTPTKDVLLGTLARCGTPTLALASDARRAAFIDVLGHLSLVDLTTGDVTAIVRDLVPAGSTCRAQLRWLPDNTSLLVTACKDYCETFRLGTDGARTGTLGRTTVSMPTFSPDGRYIVLGTSSGSFEFRSVETGARVLEAGNHMWLGGNRLLYTQTVNYSTNSLSVVALP
jgi:hypothetical protein